MEQYYVGLDVHSRQSAFLIEHHEGRVIAQGEMPTTPAGFERLRTAYGSRLARAWPWRRERSRSSRRASSRATGSRRWSKRASGPACAGGNRSIARYAARLVRHIHFVRQLRSLLEVMGWPASASAARPPLIRPWDYLLLSRDRLRSRPCPAQYLCHRVHHGVTCLLP